jgi:hypothetical protein
MFSFSLSNRCDRAKNAEAFLACALVCILVGSTANVKAVAAFDSNAVKLELPNAAFVGDMILQTEIHGIGVSPD